MSTLKLYGIDVQAGEYQKLKSLTDLLVGATTTDVPRTKARRACVFIAADAIRRASEVR